MLTWQTCLIAAMAWLSGAFFSAGLFAYARARPITARRNCERRAGGPRLLSTHVIWIAMGLGLLWAVYVLVSEIGPSHVLTITEAAVWSRL